MIPEAKRPQDLSLATGGQGGPLNRSKFESEVKTRKSEDINSHQDLRRAKISPRPKTREAQYPIRQGGLLLQLPTPSPASSGPLPLGRAVCCAQSTVFVSSRGFRRVLGQMCVLKDFR